MASCTEHLILHIGVARVVLLDDLISSHVLIRGATGDRRSLLHVLRPAVRGRHRAL